MKPDAVAGQIIERTLASGDETAIVELFRAVFSRPMGKTESLRHWNWEYRENPWGPGVVRLAFKDDRLISHYAAVPRVLELPGGRRAKGALSIDTMTAPEARGAGLFTRMAVTTYRELAEIGTECVFGFPNAQSGPIFYERLGWVRKSDLAIYVRVLPVVVPESPNARQGLRGLFLAALARYGSVRDGPIDPPKSTGGGWNDSMMADRWISARPTECVATWRSAEYLSWRYRSRPETDYDCVTLRQCGDVDGAVLGYEERRGLVHGAIMEMLVGRDDYESATRLLHEVIAVAHDRKVDVLTALCPPERKMCAVYERSGFMRVPTAWVGEPLSFGVHIQTDKASYRAPWYLTWGDTDLI